MTEHLMGEQVEPLDPNDPAVAEFAADLRHPGAVRHEQRAERRTRTFVVEDVDGGPGSMATRTVEMVSGSNHFAPTGRRWTPEEMRATREANTDPGWDIDTDTDEEGPWND